jgi:hypothetical protein
MIERTKKNRYKCRRRERKRTGKKETVSTRVKEKERKRDGK